MTTRMVDFGHHRVTYSDVTPLLPPPAAPAQAVAVAPPPLPATFSDVSNFLLSRRDRYCTGWSLFFASSYWEQQPHSHTWMLS